MSLHVLLLNYIKQLFQKHLFVTSQKVEYFGCNQDFVLTHIQVQPMSILRIQFLAKRFMLLRQLPNYTVLGY